MVIDNQEVEYISDYPAGWKISAGDPFKFPVTIGDQICFVKRFQVKNPENISGWPLLQQLKGKAESYLPSIFDIQTVKEKENEISYVIYKFLEGKTLEQIINEGETIDLESLTADIFNSLELIHSYGFWFADFCEKNIFCETGGRYILLDIDSAQPLSEYPANDMYGSKDYWIPVYKFYKEVLNQPQIKLKDINGMALDYLQFMFLLLHLKLFKESNNKNYKSIDNYSALATDLAKYNGFKELFLNIYQNNSPVLSSETVEEIKKLIQDKLISKPMDINAGASRGAIIHEFKSNTNTVQRGGAFTLSWNVEADKTDLYRNGVFFQTLGSSQQSLEKTEFYDSEKDVTYELVAIKNGIQARSKPLVISLSKGSPTPSAEISGFLLQHVQWAKLIGLSGILICLVTIFFNFLVGAMEPAMFITLIPCLLFLVPLVHLFKYAGKLKPSLFNNDNAQLLESFKHLMDYIKWMGILILISFIVFLFVLIVVLLEYIH